ncbi:MAG: hypothetical protein SXV54_04090, partial [Chloroflexota bacterium]|nr:hypothetical protein [Chloroflexota bacterium]
MDKLRCLLTTSGIWLALVGVVVLASTLLRDHSGDSNTSHPPSQSKFRLTVVVLFLCLAGHVAAYGWLASERHNRFNSTGYDLAIKEQVVWNTELAKKRPCT